jgi:hypothetical protein
MEAYMASKTVLTRSSRRIFFKNKDMDFYLMCILANESRGGASYGEAMYAASHIKENNPHSWSEEWIRLGERAEKRAERSLSQGHTVSARNAYLRAYTYLRWGGHSLSVKNPLRAENYHRFVACFRKAAELMEIYIEPIRVAWELRGKDAFVPGYFMSPDNTGKKRPTVIAINGGEMYPEDQYFWAGAAAVERGYNYVSITYEGQPAPPILYPDWSPVGPDAVNDLPGGPFGFMVDYALSRLETDPERLVGIGFSGGGYHMMLQASVDSRLKAVVLDPPIFDPLAMVEEEFPKSLQKAPPAILKVLTSFAGAVNPFTKVALEGLLSIARVETLPEFLEMMNQTRPVNPQDVGCPSLCLVGEGDSSQEQSQFAEFFAQVSSVRKKELVFAHSEGASAHCQVDNFPLFEQIAFDWLDETLGDTGVDHEA